MALLEVLVPLVTKQLCAVPKISEASRCACERGERPSGSERSPRDSTDTERSVRKIMEEKASWKPWRKGERSKALPLLWPGVCQAVPARRRTYCRRASQKRGSQKEAKRWPRRSRWRMGLASTEKGFCDQRRLGRCSLAWPGRVTRTLGMAGKKVRNHVGMGRPAMACSKRGRPPSSSSSRKRQHPQPASERMWRSSCAPKRASSSSCGVRTAMRRRPG